MIFGATRRDKRAKRWLLFSEEVLMNQRTHSTRRDFLWRTGGLASAALLTGNSQLSSIAARAADKTPPSDRIRIGHIGVGNQGGNNLKALLANTVAVCDVDRTRLAAAKSRVEKE